MLSYFRWVLFFIALFVTLMGGALFLGNTLLTAAGPLDKTKNIVIARGAGPATMAKVLRDEGVIEHDRLFRLALMIDPSPKPIKAGEYEIPAHISMQALVELLQSGKVVQRRLTVVEGMTTAEVVELVRKTEALAGEITLDLKEGDLLPETYFYSRDDTRDGLLSRMKEAMDKTLDEAWRKRAAGLPLANRREALVLASMIEKETAVPAERAKVAAVYPEPAAPQDEARERPDDDLRPDRRQGGSSTASLPAPTCSRTHPTIPTWSWACRPARSAIRDAPRSWRRPIRGATARSISWPTARAVTPSPPTSWSTTAMSSAGGRSSASARNNSSRRRRRRRARRCPFRRPSPRRRRRGSEPCRSFFWPSLRWRSWPSPSSGSCAPIHRRSRGCCGPSWSCWASSASAAC